MEWVQQQLAMPGLLQIAIRVAIIVFIVWLAFTILRALASVALRIVSIFVIVVVIWYVLTGLPLGG